MEKNNADTARKNKELMDKIQDLDAVKRKYEETIAANPDANLSSSKVDYFLYKKINNAFL